MGILGSNEELPDAKVAYITGKTFSIYQINERIRTSVEGRLRDRRAVKEGTTISIDHVDGKFEVIYLNPDKAEMVEETKIFFRDRVYYRPGWEEFDVREDRVLELADELDLEDYKEISKPGSFARVLDKTDDEVIHIPHKDMWALQGFYYQFN